MSHISSYPAVVLPVAAAVASARGGGFVAIVDGAHCLGNLAIDLTVIDPDFYFANGHKWLYRYVRNKWLGRCSQ
jgi:selenocysteine lyase/cysteine desulfurase